MDFKERIKKIAKHSKTENKLAQTENLSAKKIAVFKKQKLILSTFVALFLWLGIGLFLKNIALSLGLAVLFGGIIFFIMIQIPLIKNRVKARKIEAQLPLFLMKMVTEVRLGKNLISAIQDCCDEKNEVCDEFLCVLNDMKKGMSFYQALEKMNQRIESPSVKRACSHLNNINSQGEKNAFGLKKLAEELILKQRIESKEFSGKMVVYALIFVSVSAIVPAMFMSFILIGSYFMSIAFTPVQVLGISAVLFPAVDFGILLMIDSKTPLFLKE